MSNPLCTIIIPTYNHGKYIERSVQCALDQTYQNVEIIVVDDGSTDDTAERVKKFGEKIIYVGKENTGRGDNRNRAIELSNGKYIQFLDADDTIEASKLEKQVAILEADDDFTVVYSDCSCNDSEGSDAPNASYPLKEGEDVVPVLLRRTLFGIHAALTRRAAILDVGMFDPHHFAQEDWDLWLKLALKGYRYRYVSGNLAHYDQIGSSTVTNSIMMYKRTMHMLGKYLADPEFLKHDKHIVSDFVSQQNLLLATRSYNNGWWKCSRNHFLKSIKANPKLVDMKYWACIPKTVFHQIADYVTGRGLAEPKDL